MRSILKGVAALLGVVGVSSLAEAQTLRMMKSLDAPHYDGQRTTWSPTSDIVNMIQDTLVALDWDGKTAIPYLAKSWTISPDGKLYTFKLRDDVQLLQRQEVHRRRRGLQLQAAARIRRRSAPLAWRAGNIKELRAPDPYTVEYELTEPFSELLLQLTMFTNAIHNKESVEALGKDYGIKGVDGTGPWCFVSWQPRTEIVLKRHDAYSWGPSMYQNKGPVKFEKLVDQDRAGGFQPRRRHAGRPVRRHPPVPAAVHPAGASRADAAGAGGQAELPAGVLRLQDHPADGVRRARAPGDEHRHQPRRDRQGHHSSATPSRPTPSSIPRRSDFAAATKGVVKEDVELAKKLLDEAGWKVGADGIREKDGVKLAPKVLLHPGRQFRPRLRGDPGLHAQDRHRLDDLQPSIRPSRRRRWPSRITRSGP